MSPSVWILRQPPRCDSCFPSHRPWPPAAEYSKPSHQNHLSKAKLHCHPLLKTYNYFSFYVENKSQILTMFYIVLHKLNSFLNHFYFDPKPHFSRRLFLGTPGKTAQCCPSPENKNSCFLSVFHGISLRDRISTHTCLLCFLSMLVVCPSSLSRR